MSGRAEKGIIVPEYYNRELQNMPDILKMSHATALGLHAMVIAAQGDGAVTSASVAERLCASQAHISKVLQSLTNAGLLESKRGPNGGYALAKDASAVYLLQVYEALEGPMRRDGCLFAKPVCDEVRCILGDLVERVRHEVYSYLATTTLEQAARNQRRS
jgi:Rrf2 family protein